MGMTTRSCKHPHYSSSCGSTILYCEPSTAAPFHLWLLRCDLLLSSQQLPWTLQGTKILLRPSSRDPEALIPLS